MLTVSSVRVCPSWPIVSSRRMVWIESRFGCGFLQSKPKKIRSLLTMIRTSVWYVVALFGFGDCCTSLSIGASRHIGLFSLPSSTIDDGLRISAVALGRSLAEARFALIARKMTTNRRSSLIRLSPDENRLGFLVIRRQLPPAGELVERRNREASRRRPSASRRYRTAG